MPPFTPWEGPDEGSELSDIKSEIDNDEGMALKKEESDGETAKAPATTTPRKPNAKKAKATPKSKRINDSDGNESSPSKKPKGTPTKGGGRQIRPIPTSFETACEEDKMMLRLRDEENKPWGEILQAWNELTGETGTDSKGLCVRYRRIKEKMIIFSKEEEELLLKCKIEIEDNFDKTKWTQIASAMEAQGAKKFTGAGLQKKFKDLTKKGASSESNGLAA